MSRKVKLKLEQPAIMCSGRDKVECFYRGKIVLEQDGFEGIEFKSYGKIVAVLFKNNECITSGWEDLKIIKQ